MKRKIKKTWLERMAEKEAKTDPRWQMAIDYAISRLAFDRPQLEIKFNLPAKRAAIAEKWLRDNGFDPATITRRGY